MKPGGIIDSRASGIVIAPGRKDQSTLKTRGKLAGKLVEWIRRQLPGGTKRMRRNNTAIAQFIHDNYEARPRNDDLQDVLYDLTQQNTPITARQVQQITNHKNPAKRWTLDQGSLNQGGLNQGASGGGFASPHHPYLDNKGGRLF